MNRLRKSFLLGSLVLATACASKDPQPAPGGGGAAGVDDCAGRGESITAGMSRASTQGYEFELTELNPEPPVQSSTSPGNHWLVRVTDPNGDAVTGATLNIATFMPDHGHSGPPAAAVEAGDGNYSVDELLFPMPGLYRVTLSLAPASGDRQSVELMMCLGVASG